MRGLVILSCLASLVSIAAADRMPPSDKCVPVRQPVVKPRKLKAPRCHKAPAALQKAIRAEIAKEYYPTKPGGRGDVTFPCDGLGARIREITYQTGGGHGGGLQLWNARRVGTDFDVHGILYNDRVNVPLSLAIGKVVLPDLERVRAGLTAKVREVAPPPKPGTGGGSAGGSSQDFHVLIRLVDDDGRVVERQFTGYAGSTDQDRYLGLQAAEAALAPMTALEGKPLTPTADDRAFFAQRFNAAVPHFGDDFYWWVMERFVGLARFVGSPATIEGLLTRLDIGKTQDRSKVDARKDAVEAIAAITGWDAREGGNKTVEQAAASYLAECRP